MKFIKAAFNLLARYTSYGTAVAYFSALTSGFLALFFVIYIMEAIRFPQDFWFSTLLFLSVTVVNVIISAFSGLFFRWGWPGFTKTVKTVNTLIDTRYNITIKKITNQQAKDLLKALNLFPFQISISIAIGISFIFFVLLSYAILSGYSSLNILFILSGALISIFISGGFNIIFSELITGQMRVRIKKLIYQRNIPFKDRLYSTIKFKFAFFIILFLIGMYIVFLLTYNNKNNIQAILTFGSIVILVCLLMAYLVFYVIISSIKEMENTADDLRSGGKGLLFTKSQDKEFVQLSNDVNSAAETILDYKENLEAKVDQRTHELALVNEKLVQKNKSMDVELEFAADIQAGTIPLDITKIDRFKFQSYYKPMHKVSGDYFDYIATGKSLFIIMADVSGHGIPAALITMAAKQVFSDIVSDDKSTAAVFHELNEILVNRIETQDYLTAFLIKADNDGNISYSNAAHGKAIIQIAKTKEILELDTEGLFIGAWPEATYQENKTKLNTNDRIFLYTDGLTEQRNSQGLEFGLERLIKSIQIKSDSIETAHKNIIEAFEEYCDVDHYSDDVSLVSIEFS